MRKAAPTAARRRGVVGAAVLRQGFAKLSERERCHGREREAPGLRCCCPLFPPLYIGPREESILPKAPHRCLPPFGLFLFLDSWRMGLLGLVPLAHIGQGAHPYSPCDPPGQVDPLGGPPDPFRHSRYNTDKVRNFSGDQNKTSHI